MKPSLLRIGLLLLALGAIVAADPPAKPAMARPPKLVMCWYMVCYGSSVEFYKQEIELAQRHGIDGFILDVGSWAIAPQNNNYTESTERIYEAAKQLGTGFKLAMGPEYSVQPYAESLADMCTRRHGHPNQLQLDGKDVLSSYGINTPALLEAKEKLAKAGIAIALLPDCFPPRFEYNSTPERVQRMLDPAFDGLISFEAKPAAEILRENAIKRRVTRNAGKLYAASVVPAYNSANLEDYHGLQGYGAMWEGAMRDGADWISIVIWNDYNEDSGLMPFRWPAGAEKDFFDRDESFLCATAYYASWFKTGVRPVITQDKLFVTYRTRGKWLRQVYDPKTKQWSDLCLRQWPYDQIHDNVQDAVYVDTFLTAPAAVTLTIGDGKPTVFQLPAGVGHAEAPMAAGVPRLVLSRDSGGKSAVLAEVTGRRQIIAKETETNSVLGTSQHLANRTWCSGTVVGPALRLAATDGKLLAGASLVQDGAVSAVENKPADGSGFELPLSGLTTGTYNIRITYCNPAADDARLTLIADGPPRAANEHPYFIPAWLPATGAGQYRTVSFLWSLYAGSSRLQVVWTAAKVWGNPEPAMDDRGVVRIAAIELIPSLPFTAGTPPSQAFPELVAIPGGSFAMGSTAGEPDEAPVHQVTLSPFAIGRYEVTNAEFERFDPTHAEHRTSLSWRDREPVIAVSWVDGAKFCNWLSSQNRLAPAYAEVEGNWKVDLAAEGFRLPTEAEWEYVASGRGQGRLYPWGDAPAEPMLQGNFQGRRALDFTRPQTSSEGGGTTVAGSFPAGASRDGVMDLAGNVGEWCSDWYAPYAAGEQRDPCNQVPGNYRSIRGGSWGWYGWDQRGANREFNSQGYPGHCYYGFRVALSAAGCRKLGVK